MKHLLEACVHNVLFDELPAVSLRDALSNYLPVAAIFFEEMERSIFHKLLRSRSFMPSDVSKLGLLFGSE